MANLIGALPLLEGLSSNGQGASAHRQEHDERAQKEGHHWPENAVQQNAGVMGTPPQHVIGPPLLVEEAGERLAVDLFGEVILPPQNAVSVLLVVPLTGRNVRTLRVEDQLLFVEVQQRHGVGLGVVDKDLQAGVEGRPLAIRSAREHALEHLLWTQHRHHRAVGRLALEALQGRAEPAEAQDEEAEDPAGDQEQAQPDALVLGLGVLVRHPDLRHGSPAETSAGMESRNGGGGGWMDGWMHGG